MIVAGVVQSVGEFTVTNGVVRILTKKLSSSEQVPSVSYIQTVWVEFIGPVITVPPLAFELL